MKKVRFRWPFALLLVLPVLLFVLPGISIPTDRGSKKVKSQMSVNALARAIESFGDEYGKLPDVSLLDLESEGPEATKLITILLGKEEEGHDMQNPHQINFLADRMTKDKGQGGIVFYSGNKIEGIYDTWGNPLRIIMRPPGKEEIAVQYGEKQVVSNKPAVTLSRGRDRKWGTEDDLISADEAR